MREPLAAAAFGARRRCCLLGGHRLGRFCTTIAFPGCDRLLHGTRLVAVALAPLAVATLGTRHIEPALTPVLTIAIAPLGAIIRARPAIKATVTVTVAITVAAMTLHAVAAPISTVAAIEPVATVHAVVSVHSIATIPAVEAFTTVVTLEAIVLAVVAWTIPAISTVAAITESHLVRVLALVALLVETALAPVVATAIALAVVSLALMHLPVLRVPLLLGEPGDHRLVALAELIACRLAVVVDGNLIAIRRHGVLPRTMATVHVAAVHPLLLTVRKNDAVVVLGVLKIVLSQHRVAGRERIARQ